MTSPSLFQRAVGLLLWGWAAWMLLVVVGIGLWGRGYYALDRVARETHPLHGVLASGAGGGVLLGITGTALMTAMLAYTVRKRFPRATWPGPMALWLRFHVLCGIFGPLFIVLHAGVQRPEGIVAVAFWCMVLVASSGIFGRYVYGWLPRLATGQALAWGETKALLSELHAELVAVTVGSPSPAVGQALSLVRDFEQEAETVGDLLRLDREVRARRQRIHALLGEADLDDVHRHQARAVLDEQLRLKQSLEASRVGYRLFRWWHLFHRPLASAMYVIVALHVLFALLFGGSLGRVAELFAGGAP